MSFGTRFVRMDLVGGEDVFGGGWLECSHKGFNKSHGMALEFVYRAENQRKSSGAPAGAFPRPPTGPGWLATN